MNPVETLRPLFFSTPHIKKERAFMTTPAFGDSITPLKVNRIYSQVMPLLV